MSQAGCETHIPKPFSLPRIVLCRRVLHPRWCQSGVRSWRLPLAAAWANASRAENLVSARHTTLKLRSWGSVIRIKLVFTSGPSSQARRNEQRPSAPACGTSW